MKTFLFLILILLSLSNNISAQGSLIGKWEDKNYKGQFLDFVNDSTLIMRTGQSSYDYRYKIDTTQNPNIISLFPIKKKGYNQDLIRYNVIKGIFRFISTDEIFLNVKLFDENLFGDNAYTKAHYIRYKP